ncbi:DUF3381 domain-containing protein [archaeon]|nr:MAG: DUF3381 domain-containing protein [archaeon]
MFISILIHTGKGEFKKLLKWRTSVKDTLKVENEPVGGTADGEEGKVVVEIEEDEDVKIAREISEMREKDSLARKKEDKKSRKEMRKVSLGFACMPMYVCIVYGGSSSVCVC